MSVAATDTVRSDAGRTPPTARRLLTGTGLVLLWLACVVVTLGLIYNNKDHHSFGKDSHAYWLIGQHSRLYGLAPGKQDAYLYSPAFATLIWPLTKLPWSAFLVIWAAIEAAAFVWLLAPLKARWSIPLLLICGMEAITGDIYGLLGVVAVLGFTRPQLWAFPLLTKIAPGAGVLWFALRKEWRNLGIALGATAAVAVVSAALTPHLWSQWVHFLIDHRGHSTLLFPVRLPVGLAALVIGARTNRRWLLPVGMMLAMPMAANLWTLTMLAPIPRLLTTHRGAGEVRTAQPRSPTASAATR